MTRILTFFFIAACFTLTTSCETEAEKEARQIILTQEEAEAVKTRTASSGRYSKPALADGDEAIEDQAVASHEDCKPMSLNELLVMFRTGKKRDLLEDKNFMPTFSYAFAKNKNKTQAFSTDKITYGRCFYGDTYDTPRHKIVVTHTPYDYLWYWTTEKDVFDALIKEVVDAGATTIRDTADGYVKKFYSLHGGEIEFSYRIKPEPGDERKEYEVEIRRSIPTDTTAKGERAKQIESFNAYLETL